MKTERIKKAKPLTAKKAESLARGFREFGWADVTGESVSRIWDQIGEGTASETDPLAIWMSDAYHAAAKVVK